MNPFRPPTAKDVSVSITEDDLIAFHLHELPPTREQDVRRAMERSPSLAAESEAIASTFSALKDDPMHIDNTVLDRNWNAVRPSLIAFATPPLGVRAPRWRFATAAAALAAFAATIAIVAVRHSSSTTEPSVGPSADAVTGSNAPSTQGAEIGGSDTFSSQASQPLFKISPRSGVFRSGTRRTESPIHLLTLAATPPMDRVAPLFPPETELMFSPVPVPETAGQTPPPSIAQKLFPAFGQVDPQPSRRAQPFPRARARALHTTDVMLAVGGDFIVPHNAQSATHAIAAVGAFHQQFRQALGYRITASYSRPDFSYDFPRGAVNSRIFSLAGTYVIKGPHHRGLSTSVDAGVGGLAFLPANAAEATSHLYYRVAGIAGANVDYAFTRHWGTRLAYRAEVFRGANFAYIGSGGSTPLIGRVTVSNEPSLGITYRFGKTEQ